MIMYYSGTGNGRLLALKMQSLLHSESLALNDLIRRGEGLRLSDQDVCLIISPVYAWRIPRILEGLLASAKVQGQPKLYFLLHCGSEIGGAEAYIRALCREHAFNYGGTAAVVMPENYTAMFDTPEPAEAAPIIARALSRLEPIAETIRRGQRLQPDPALTRHAFLSRLANAPFYRFFVKADRFQVNEHCISCGQCARLCPLKNIVLPDGRPIWGDRCTHCMACINYCPAEAISCGRQSIGRYKYTAEKCFDFAELQNQADNSPAERSGST